VVGRGYSKLTTLGLKSKGSVMNSVGQSGEKKSYPVILLLVVGLAAFSSAMKELNQVREFTREASNLVASWSKAVEPAPEVDRVVPVEVPRTAARLEVCENRYPANEAEPLPNVHGGVIVAKEPVEVKGAAQTVVTVRAPRREVQTLRKLRPVDIDLIELRNQARHAAELKVLMMADGDEADAEISVPSELNLKLPKVKELPQFKVGTKEHDVILKSLNRSINVRSAG
jgi:hypothetical protein